MEQGLTVFSNKEFGTIRAFKNEQGEPCFVAKDVLDVLDLNRSSLTSLENDDKGVHTMYTLGGDQQFSVIKEGGLYELIFKSRKPEAKAFKRWVTHEVLPSIRKQGVYVANAMGEDELITKAFIICRNRMVTQSWKIADLEERVRVLEEKVRKYEQPVEIYGSCSIGALARMLNDSGYETGRGRLFKQLRDEGYLIRDGEDYNMPKQEYINMGLFRILQKCNNNRTAEVTEQGQAYFLEHYAGVEAQIHQLVG